MWRRLLTRRCFSHSAVKERVKTIPPINEFMKQSATLNAGIETQDLEKTSNLDGKRYFIETYGCQMNEADSEIVNSILQANGMRQTNVLADSDLILLNTCAIRENAENKVLQRLNEIRNEKNKNKHGFLIGVLGCMAERMKVDLIEKNKAVDIVVGPDAYRDLPRLVSDLMVF